MRASLTPWQESTRVYLNYFTISLAITLARLYSSYKNAQDEFYVLLQRMESECDKVENGLQTFVDGAQKLVQAAASTTEDFVNGITDTIVNAFVSLIMFLGQIVLYLIDTYKSTVQCVLTNILDKILGFLKDSADKVQEIIQTVSDGAIDAANAVQTEIPKGLNTALNGIDFLNVIPDDPVPVPEELVKPDLPNVFSDILKQIPDKPVETWLAVVDEYIMKPFEFLADLFKNAAANNKVSIQINMAHIRAPRIELCSNVMKELESLDPRVMDIVFIVFAVVIFIAAVLYMTVIWRIKNVETALLDTHGKGMSIHEYQHFYTVVACSKIPNISHRTKKFLVYIMYEPTFICFCLGLVSLLFNVAQLKTLEAMERDLLPRVKTILKDNITDEVLAVTGSVRQSLVENVNAVNIFSATAEDEIGRTIGKPLVEFTSQANQTINDILDQVQNWVDENLGKGIGFAVENVIECVVEARTKKFFKVLDMIFKLKLSLPKISVDSLLDKLDAVDRKLERMKMLLDELVARVLKRLYDRINREIIMSAIICAFPALILIQGFIFVWLRG